MDRALRLSLPAALALVLAVAGASFAAPPAPPCAPCARWELGAAEARALAASGRALEGLTLLLRADVDATTGARLAARGARLGRVWDVAADGLPQDVTALETLLLVAHGVDAHERDAVAARLKTLATEARARRTDLAVGLAAPADVAGALWTRGVAAYLDYVVPQGAAMRPPDGVASWDRAGAPLSAMDALDATRSGAGAPVLMPWPAGSEVAFAVAALREALPPGLTPLPEVTVACRPHTGADPCAAEVFLHPVTLDAIALVRAADAAVPVSVSPAPAHVARLPIAEDAFALRIEGWAGDAARFASGLEVIDEKALTVEEVIARHQAAAARQKRLVPRFIAYGASVLAFHAPGLAAPVTVTAQTTVYAGPEGTDIEQRGIRLNGADLVSIGADGVPRLPILEPQRADRPPLSIALDEAYRYRLAGRERVRDRDAYVVDFEPRDARRALFRGRAWIDARQFALLRLQAAQTALRGPIVSSEQRDEFAAVVVGAETVWLLARSEVAQSYEGAGHRTPITRLLALEGHEVDPPDYDARLQAAHGSSAVMLRETPDGLRYLRRTGAAEHEAERAPAARRASSVRTLALGAIVDPNISGPLPFAGLSYLDFDFLGTGAQVNAFLAGAFVQASLAAPSLAGSRWQLHGSLLATLAEYNDRTFRGGVEQYAENLRQRPARLALALVRPLSARWRARAGYELEYTRLRRSELTAPSFVVPASPLVHAFRLSLEGQRGPWSFAGWWSPARRAAWHAWGLPGADEGTSEAVGFQRFGVSASRAMVLSPRALVRVEAAALGGRGLDRFSRFSFDAFDNRLRGYPSAGLRFDRGAVLRTAGTWNVAPGIRLDAFADTAFAHDPGFGTALLRYSGVGAGLEAPLPWRMLLSAEWGFGFEGRDRDGGRGTHVVRVTAYKIF